MALFGITSLNNWLTFRSLTIYIISTIALYHVIRKIRKFYLLYQAIERLPGPKITYNVFLGNLYVYTANNHADILTRKCWFKTIFMSINKSSVYQRIF